MELEKLKEIIGRVLNRNTDTVTEKTTFADDLGADSLDLFRIVLEIEEIYDIEIDSETAEQIATVGDAVQALRRETMR
nr:acyl carrier protein [uncultured Blautia sp.]